MSAGVRKYVSRYVVPFNFNYENNGYETLRKHFLSSTSDDNQALALPKDGHWVNAGFWENYKSDKETQAEMDIYSYLPSIFLEDKDANEKSVSNLGVSFVYKTSGKLFELEYKEKSIPFDCKDLGILRFRNGIGLKLFELEYKEKSIAFDCKDLGILLFRNGIGFIWYEIEFKKEVSIDEYVEFQNEFKELARTHGECFKKKTGFDKEKREGIYETFCLGEWLSKMVAADDLGIRFWAERETKKEDGNIVRIPDKALLFQYLFIEQTKDQERNNIIFRIANGYNEKYNAPENIDENLYKPFGNTCFYVSNAGMACVAKKEDTNEAFFDGQFREKYVRDYFFIYILLAYQSYSCAHYSRLLTKLPADAEKFNEQIEYAKKLESLNEEINLFLVKSVFESVSNIHHQNGVYIFGKSALRIEEDIRSLTIGLGALEEMVEDKRKQKEQQEKDAEKKKLEERDHKINHALIIFGFMVVVSAWIDGLNLVDWFMKNGKDINPWHGIISAVIILLTLYLIITLLWNRKKK